MNDGCGPNPSAASGIDYHQMGAATAGAVCGSAMADSTSNIRSLHTGAFDRWFEGCNYQNGRFYDNTAPGCEWPWRARESDNGTTSQCWTVQDPTTWTILQKHGPDHLGLRYNALPDHQMALNTSGCVPFRTRRRRRSERDTSLRSSATGAVSFLIGLVLSCPHPRAYAPSPGTQSQVTPAPYAHSWGGMWSASICLASSFRSAS